MYDTKITWDGEQHVVWLSHPFDWRPISIPLEDWFKLPAVQYVVDLALEGSRQPASPLGGSQDA